MKTFESIGGTWAKVDKNGEVYLSGEITVNDQVKLKIWLHHNDYKTVLNNVPDYVVYAKTADLEELRLMLEDVTGDLPF